MLRPTQLFLFVAGFAASAAPLAVYAQPRSVGVYGLWGAFRDAARCYAIARPSASSSGRTNAFASVAYWPRQRARGLTMTLETRSVRGGILRDVYQLRGAPSAIDAAALACAGG
jgi:hypothetical protein